MNYGMHLSCLVEDKLAEIDRPHDWTQLDEAQAYDRCLKEVLQMDEMDGKAWADGNIRIGDYILLGMSHYSVQAEYTLISLVDSDTRVPRDCLLDAASEMEQSPEIGIMQFSSGVMQVVHTYFENG